MDDDRARVVVAQAGGGVDQNLYSWGVRVVNRSKTRDATGVTISVSVNRGRSIGDAYDNAMAEAIAIVQPGIRERDE
jgi:hypothetical protein